MHTHFGAFVEKCAVCTRVRTHASDQSFNYTLRNLSFHMHRLVLAELKSKPLRPIVFPKFATYGGPHSNFEPKIEFLKFAKKIVSLLTLSI